MSTNSGNFDRRKSELEALRLRIAELERSASLESGGPGTASAQEDWFQAHYFGLPIPTYLWKKCGDDFVLVNHNEAARDITHGAIAGFIGKRAREMYSDRPAILSDLTQCCNDRSVLRREMLYRFATTGEEKFFSVIYSFLMPDLVIVHTIDITEFMQAKEAVANSKRSFIELAELLPGVVFELDTQANIAFVNEKGFELFGYSREDLKKGLNARQVIVPEEHGALEYNLQQALDGRTPDLREYTFLTKDGRRFPAMVYASPAVVNGSVTGLRGYLFDISERKKAETALRQSESQYRKLVEQISAITYTARTDETSSTLYVSPQIETVLGFSPARMMAEPTLWMNQVHPDDRERVTKELLESRATGKLFLSEYRMLSKDGRTVWIRDEGNIINDDMGRPHLLQGIMIDITERKLAQDALQASEERYRAIWENSPIGICLTDRNGIYHYVNPTYCRIYGYSKEELIGRPFYEMIMPKGHPRANAQAYAELFNNPGTVMLDESEGFIRKNGEPVYIQFSSDYVWENGVPRYLVAMNIDITEKKRAEKALLESEQKYRMVIENAGEIIVTLSTDGVFLMMNRSAARYFGGKPADYIGKSLRDLFPGEMAERFLENVRKVTATGHAILEEDAIPFRGEQRWFRTNLQPIVNPDGTITTALVMVTDITIPKYVAVRNEARLQLLQRLRKARDVDECLTHGCLAVVESCLFMRAVLTLHNDKREITNLGQQGLEEQLVRAARSAPAPDKELTRRMTQDKYRMSHSYFIPVEEGVFSNGTGRLIPQAERLKEVPDSWRSGDEMFVPILDNENRYEGWLSVDSPFNGRRPTLEVALCLEEILDIVAKQVHEIQTLEKLRRESQALLEKNIALKQVLDHIEEEKGQAKQQIGASVAQVLIPALNKLVRKDGTVNKTCYNLLKNSLPELVTATGALIHLYSKLSPREREICSMIRNGASSKEIAAALSISLVTVHKHREIIRRKLGITNKNVNLANHLKSI